MNFLENVAGIVMVCNFERDISIGKILDWKRDITNHVEKKIPIVLVANKIDYYDGDFDKIKKVEKCLEEIAFQNGFLCSFLVSAKDNLNINELFFNVINFCIEGNKNLI